jgi:hypothetical protein
MIDECGYEQSHHDTERIRDCIGTGSTFINFILINRIGIGIEYCCCSIGAHFGNNVRVVRTNSISNSSSSIRHNVAC